MGTGPGLFIQESIADPPPPPVLGSAGPWGLGGERISLSDRLLKRSREWGAGSCQPACFCEGAVPRKSTHLLRDVAASLCTLLCMSRLALFKLIIQDSNKGFFWETILNILVFYCNYDVCCWNKGVKKTEVVFLRCQLFKI